MEAIIRNMAKEDLPFVRKVAEESWHATYEGIIPRDVQDNFLKSAYNDEMLLRRWERGLFFVAEIDGRIAGFANFFRLKEPEKAELASIYLLTKYKGMGIGSKLLQAGIDHLQGVKEIYVSVERENSQAIRFYEARGFRKIEEYEETFDGHILHTIKMVLKV